MPNFAANLSFMFNEWDFLDRFGAAADAGFTAVEFLFPYDHAPDEIATRLARYNLTQILFNLSPGDWAAGDRGLAALPARREAFLASVDTALTYADALGVQRLHMLAGIAEPGEPGTDTAYRTALTHLCAKAAPKGVTVLIEPINRRDIPGYYLADFNLAVDIIRDLALPNLKLQFDIYHRQIIHGDVLTALQDLLPLIDHVQIAAVPGRNEPGSGELDDVRVLRALDALGYRGHVGCEYRPANGTLAGLSWLKAFNA